MSATHVACHCKHYEWVVYKSVPNLFNYKIVLTLYNLGYLVFEGGYRQLNTRSFGQQVSGS